MRGSAVASQGTGGSPPRARLQTAAMSISFASRLRSGSQSHLRRAYSPRRPPSRKIGYPFCRLGRAGRRRDSAGRVVNVQPAAYSSVDARAMGERSAIERIPKKSTLRGACLCGLAAGLRCRAACPPGVSRGARRASSRAPSRARASTRPRRKGPLAGRARRRQRRASRLGGDRSVASDPRSSRGAPRMGCASRFFAR